MCWDRTCPTCWRLGVVVGGSPDGASMYDGFAEEYLAYASDGAFNAYYDRPAVLFFVQIATRQVHIAGGDRPSDQRLGRPTGAERADGPRATYGRTAIPAARPGQQIRRPLRRGVQRRRHRRDQDSTTGAASELVRGALGGHRPPRVHRPDAHHQRTSPGDRYQRVHRALQRSPSTSFIEPTSTESSRGRHEGAHRAGPSTPAPPRPDQRVFAGSVAEPNIRARWPFQASGRSEGHVPGTKPVSPKVRPGRRYRKRNPEAPPPPEGRDPGWPTRRSPRFRAGDPLSRSRARRQRGLARLPRLPAPSPGRGRSRPTARTPRPPRDRR